MITFEYCEACDEWREFFKKGRNPSETKPWVCTVCGWDCKDFPQHESPITWAITGRRPK